MVNKQYVDTSVWVEYFAGSIPKELIEKSELCTSIIAVAELADKFEKEEVNPQQAVTFIRMNAKIISLSIEVCLQAAKVKHTHRKKKERFSLADAIHYVSSQNEGTLLLTTDKDFVGLENVKVL